MPACRRVSVIALVEFGVRTSNAPLVAALFA
jgi:hypothetical protein